MAQKENISFKEKVFSTVKQFVIIVCAIVTAVISIQGYLRNSMKDMIKEALTEFSIPVDKKLHDHYTSIVLLAYRMDQAEASLKIHQTNLEAILPKETEIEDK